MKEKFTKETGYDEKTCAVYSVVGTLDGDRIIARINMVRAATGLADGYLFAASSKMYAVLKKLSLDDQVPECYIVEIEQALHAARGETFEVEDDDEEDIDVEEWV